MFGRGRFNPGVIVDPKPEFAFDPEDQEKLAEFRNKIWYVGSGSHLTGQKFSIRVWVRSLITARLTMVPAGRRLNE